MKDVICAIDKGESREDENRDCTVRALANAELMDYDDAHELLAYYGRPSRRGAKFGTMFPAPIFSAMGGRIMKGCPGIIS